MELSRNNEILLMAFDKGYRIKNGEIHSPFNGIIKGGIKKCNNLKYKVFGVRYKHISVWKTRQVFVHRLVAYQKYGDLIFKGGMEVRHKDCDSLNNLGKNILMGTHSQNMMDVDAETRLKNAISASTKTRKFSDEDVLKIRERYGILRSYKKIMEEFDISSKGSLHSILNRKYVTTK